MHRCLIAAILLLTSALPLAAPAQTVSHKPRTWQPAGSADVEAMFVSESAGKVSLRTVDGRSVSLDVAALGDEDLRYLKNVRDAAANGFRTWRLAQKFEAVLAERRDDQVRLRYKTESGTFQYDARSYDGWYTIASFSPADAAYIAQKTENRPRWGADMNKLPLDWRTWSLKSESTFTAAFVEIRGMLSVEPCVVVVRDDFRRRAVPLVQFSAEDKAYALKLREQRVAAGKKQTAEYKLKPDAYDPVKDKAVANVHTTEHFAFWYGNQVDDSGKAWNDPAFREMNYKAFEDMWDFYEAVVGAPMPCANSAEKTKYNVYIFSTGLPKHQKGWAFGASSALMHPGALMRGSSVYPHEVMGHGLQAFSGGFVNNPLVGWFWESHANWSMHQSIPNYPAVLDAYADRAHYALNSTRFNYGSWSFLQYMAEHPRFQPAFCYEVWLKNRKNDRQQSVEDPFQTIQRVGVEKGLFKGDGVEGFGDIIGQMAAHNAAWDYVLHDVYARAVEDRIRNWADWTDRSRAVLRPVADRPGWFKPLNIQAPRQYGYNVIDLLPAAGAAEVTVELAGAHSPKDGLDWRATLVAVDDAGNARYSRTIHEGKATLKRDAHDKRLMLAVAAAPSLYVPTEERPGYNKNKPRYHYEVTFTGARPADAPQMRQFEKPEGKKHPNGGGFVANGAKVDPTAWVGPTARVLGGAKVLGNARIEDYAVVREAATVQDNAIVGGWAVVEGSARIGGSARIRGCAFVRDAQIDGNARVLEYVHVDGRGSIGGDALIKGWGEVHTDASAPVSGGAIFGEELECHLSAWKKPIAWGRIYGWNGERNIDEGGDNQYRFADWDFNRDSGEILKDSCTDNEGLLRGKPTYGEESGRQFLSLNGTDQYALVEALVTDTAAITFDAEVLWQGSSAGQCLFDFASREGRIWFSPSERGGAYFGIQKGTLLQGVTCSKPLPAGKWVRLTITADGQAGRIYFDGALAGENRQMKFRPEDARAAYSYLGRSCRGGGFFKGQLDRLTIYRKAWEDVASIPAPAAPKK